LNLKSFLVSYAWIFLIPLLLAVVLGMVWVNLQWINFLPQESEFFYCWQITRGFIFDQINPYQTIDGYTFTYPFPSLVLYFPFALIGNYELARSAWITGLQLATAIFAYQCLRNTSWKTNRWQMIVILVFALFWFPAVSIYIRGSETAILAVFFLAALLAIQKGRDELGGIYLILSALQFRFTILGVVLVLLWIAAQRRWLTFFWAGITFLFTSGIGIIFLTSWPVDFFWATLRSVDFSIGRTIIETTSRWWPGIGLQVGWSFIILATLLLIVEWWLVRGKGARRLTWTLALTWVIAIWIGFETNIDHVFLLLFPLMVIFAAWDRRWGRPGLIFSWIMMALLLSGLWWAFISFGQRDISEASNPILMIGFPLMVLMGLYWVRWWYLRPEYLNLNES
jgi:hypothetical protein